MPAPAQGAGGTAPRSRHHDGEETVKRHRLDGGPRYDGPSAEAMRQVATTEATTGEALVAQWRKDVGRTPTNRDYADLAKRINLCTAQMVRRALVLTLRHQILGAGDEAPGPRRKNP